MQQNSIRAGDYRTVTVSEEATVIVTIDNPFNQLHQVLKISREGGSMMDTENCAVILAMALNAGLDTQSAHDAFAQYTGEADENARKQALRAAAAVARDGCLVPPDGGSPTDDEREMCDHIADAILRLV